MAEKEGQIENAPALSAESSAPKKALPTSIELKPVRFYIPPMLVYPPDFSADGSDGEIPVGATPQQIQARLEAERKKSDEAEKKREAEWKAKNEFRVTLNAHVFSSGEAAVSKNIAPELQPGYVRTLKALKVKAEAGDWEGMTALMYPKPAAEKLTTEQKEQLMDFCKATNDAEFVLILEIEGFRLAMFHGLGFVGTLRVPINKPEAEYHPRDG